jgi:ribosomal protein S18 acetylase RimI-like enzyme
MQDAVALREMKPQDLPQVLAVQAACYPPSLCEGAAAYASRLGLGPATCLVASGGQGLCGYLLSHPWISGAPPALDAVLAPRAGPADCWYIQDLAVAPARRGEGLAQSLYAAGLEAALAQRLRRSELVAVQGAEAFWSSFGYRPAVRSAELEERLRSYGPATYMARDL